MTPHPIPPTHSQPLGGLRIIELSSFVATPLCGAVLAQLGADVIRVEQLGGAPDRTRWPLSEDGDSLYWNGLNPGKRAVAVDLTDPRGRALVADLVVDGGPEGGIIVSNSDRWSELSYQSLSARRPDVIHLTLSGTHDGRTAVDYTVQAATGFPLITGPGDHSAPVNSVVPTWDLAAGLYLATGLLAATIQRKTNDTGTEIRLALEDVALAAAGHLGYLAEAQLKPTSRRQRDGNYVFGGFGRDFRSQDGERFMLFALTSRHWADLVAMTGIGETITALEGALSVDFRDEGERYVHRELIAGLIGQWFSRHDGRHVRDALSRTSVLWSPYRSFGELVSDDAKWLRQHPLFGTVDQPGVGTIVSPGSPLVLDGHRDAPRPAPAVGQHNLEVLSEVLGLNSHQVERLESAGVVGAHQRGEAK